MKIQTKITLLLLLIIGLFFAGLVFIKEYESRREELLLKNKIYDKNTLYDKIARLDEASLYMFAYDYSNRNDMVAFVSQPDPAWAAQYIDRVLPSFKVSAVWIYDTDFKRVYYSCDEGAGAALDALPTGDEFFDSVFARSYFRHFFLMTSAGLMEIRSAPIQPYSDKERRTAPRGYLFAGRLWSEDYLQHMSVLTESSIELYPIAGRRIHEARYNQEKGVITFSRIAQGWNKKPIMHIRVTSETPITRELHKTSRKQLVLLLVFVCLVIVLMSSLLIVWVNVPLKKISKSLHLETPSIIEGLTASKSEFGNLAQLILRFFRQKTELTREIDERHRAEHALRDALRASQRSEAETSALLTASRAVLEYHDFPDSAQAILDSCKKVSGAADGFIAEVSENSDGEKYVCADRRALSPGGICARACASGLPCFINDHLSLNIDSAGTVANALCAPLQIRGSVEALLVLTNKPDGFTDNDLRMGAAFSELASVALLNSRTLESLEASEERFRSVVETAPDAIITVTNEGTIVFWNKGAEMIFGHSAGEVIGREATLMLPERLHSRYYSKLARMLSGEGLPDDAETRPVEIMGLRNTGEEFPMELSQAKWKSREGAFVTVIARDISERKRAEEDLRKSEKRFRDIVEHSLTGRFIVQNDRVVYMNQEQMRLFSGIAGTFSFNDSEHIHPDDLEKVRAFYRDVLSGASQARDVDFRFFADGIDSGTRSMRWVNCRAAVIEYEGKESLFVNMMDITRIMELEQLVRVQDKMASLGRIAAGIAHEIRNPLTGINSYLYSLRLVCERLSGRDGDGAVVKDIIGEIESASNKIEAVIRRVMDFAKPGTPKLVPVDLNEPIQDALSLCAVTLRKSSIQVETDCAGRLPLCNADRHMIEQVVLNFINNAIQALEGAQEEKKIGIMSYAEQDSILIAVSDSGPGISREERDKIFDPFYTTKSDGSGIGLSLSQRIVVDHGGTVQVGTSRWGGAEFRIKLPAAADV